MNIITISREFGSGGRELGKRLAESLGYDYYDKEIINAIAEKKGMSPDFVHNALISGSFIGMPLSFRNSFSTINNAKVELLVEQKNVIEGIGKFNKNCVIVGRNADILLGEYNPLNIFVCADIKSKVKRCVQSKKNTENFTEKEMEKIIKNIDKCRIESREFITDKKWGDPHNYHLTINTSGQIIKELTTVLVSYAQMFFERNR